MNGELIDGKRTFSIEIQAMPDIKVEEEDANDDVSHMQAFPLACMRGREESLTLAFPLRPAGYIQG